MHIHTRLHRHSYTPSDSHTRHHTATHIHINMHMQTLTFEQSGLEGILGRFSFTELLQSGTYCLRRLWRKVLSLHLRKKTDELLNG